MTRPLPQEWADRGDAQIHQSCGLLLQGFLQVSGQGGSLRRQALPIHYSGSLNPAET